MFKIPFIKISPGGNTTLLSPIEGLSEYEQVHIANIALRTEHLHAEQMGFYTTSPPSLRMAGGEFCLNATRALGVVLAHMQNPPSPVTKENNISWRGEIFTSGLNTTVPVAVTQHPDLGYTASVTLQMPLPTSTELAPGIIIVHLPGIAHMLIDAKHIPFPTQWAEHATALIERFGLGDAEAVGCVWWHADAAQAYIHPVVTVKTPPTTCYEQACGSGSLAMAWYLYCTGRMTGNYTIIQPSRSPMTVSLQATNATLTACVGGPVELIAQGELFIPHNH